MVCMLWKAHQFTHNATLKLAQTSPLYDPSSAIVGTADQVEAQLRRFSDLGVQYFILRFADFPKTDMAERFAREVAPRFEVHKKAFAAGYLL